MNLNMKLAIVLLLLIVGARLRGCAQTISPVVAECGLKCSGEFKVVNNSVTPTIVLLDAVSFRIVNGKRQDLPLDSKTKVLLDQTSSRLSPKGEHAFSYKIFCDIEPCLTVIRAGFAAGKTKEGTAVVLRLPHVVYSCKSQKGCRNKALGVK
jgi:hypothetical protein